MIVCEKCGKEYDEDMSFCPYCGFRPETDSSKETDEEQAAAAKEEEAGDKEDENEKRMEAVEEEEDIDNLSPEALADALAAAKAAGENKRISKEIKSEISQEEEEDDIEIPKNKLPLSVSITVAAAFLIFAGVIMVIYQKSHGGFFNSSKAYLKPVVSYLEGYKNKDITLIIDSYPDFMSEQITKDTSPAKIWNDLNQSFIQGLGENWKADYTIGDVTDIGEADIDTIKSDLSNVYNIDLDFEAGYWVSADMELSSKKSSATIPLMFAVVEIDGEWSVVYYYQRSADADNGTATGDGQKAGNTAAE